MPSNYVDIIYNNSINMRLTSLTSVRTGSSSDLYMSTLIMPSNYVDITYNNFINMRLTSKSAPVKIYTCRL